MSANDVVAGFSEKIFDQILVHESGAEIEGEEIVSSIPTLEYVRENY